MREEGESWRKKVVDVFRGFISLLRRLGEI